MPQRRQPSTARKSGHAPVQREKIPIKKEDGIYCLGNDFYKVEGGHLTYIDDTLLTKETGEAVDHPKEILEKVCDNSLFQFIGDDFQPNKNIYSQDTLSFISLPDHHPLKYLQPAPQIQQQQIPAQQIQQQDEIDPFLIDDPNLFSKHFAPRRKYL